MRPAAQKGVRFAPSPTGIFHVGNLRSAWISRWWATALGEPWVLRFEDIDVPRNVPGAQERQLEAMRKLGCVADSVVLQSTNRSRHWALFLAAREAGAIYPCFCSRKEILAATEALASAPHAPVPIYNGRCRAGADPADAGHPTIAWRFRANDETGRADFIVARTGYRADAVPIESTFTPSYHWACAIDDADGNYKLLVRASDLDIAVDPQRAIQAWLAGFERYPVQYAAIFHASLVVLENGERLEKRTKGVTLEELAARGIEAEELVRRIERSFSAKAGDFAPGRSWKEVPERIPLSVLIA